jgi:hypothetical protein
VLLLVGRAMESLMNTDGMDVAATAMIAEVAAAARHDF